MSANTNTNRSGPGAGQRAEDVLREAITQIEAQLRHAIEYVNDAVIPEVRRESISGLRTAADKLRNLADRFERESNAAVGAVGNQTEDSPPKTSGEPRT